MIEELIYFIPLEKCSVHTDYLPHINCCYDNEPTEWALGEKNQSSG